MADIPIKVGFSKDGSLDKAMDELEAELEAITRGLTVEVWNGVLYRTPQAYGRMAASWSYSLNFPVFTDRSSMVETDENVVIPAKSAGHLDAIGVARTFSAGAETRFSLGDTVFISNAVDHGEGGYAGDIEEGNILLRPVNRPGRPVTHTLDSIHARYGSEERGISANAAQRLKGLTLASEPSNF